jgi:radical SAM protein with 4Fe4S-binding SPASM domain
MFLKENCYLVNGYRNAAIYDLNNCKVYSINSEGKDIIIKYLKNTKLIGNKKEKEYMEILKKYDLLTENIDVSNRKSMIDKPEPRLRYAWLEITGSCNLKCIHCYGQFGNLPTISDEPLTTKDWKRIIDILIENNCREIQLIGGEPMVHKDFYDILKYAHKSGMKRIDVFTNATLINEKSIQIFKQTNASIRISLYGHNQELHEKITSCRGSFKKTENALKLLKVNNIQTQIAVVIMKENEKYIQEIKKYIESLGHKYTGYDVIRPSCLLNSKEHQVTDINILKSRYNLNPEFYTSPKTFYENHFYNSCWNGKIAITYDGDIIPCIFARNDIIGNIRNANSLQDIKKLIVKKWSITKDDIEVCKDCEFRYCCHDCRPLADGIEGKSKAKYPRCCYDPYNGRWMKLKEYTKELKL